MDYDIYILKALTIMFFSTWKTYVGPGLSYACGFSYIEMLVFNLGAALTSTVFFLRYSRDIGKRLNRLFPGKNRKRFSPRYRKFIRFWNKYGLYGTMFLTPVLIGIPVSAFFSVRFGTRKIKIIYMVTIFVVLWSTIFYYLGMLGYDLVSDGVLKRIIVSLN
ncbi:MAG: hypothetical protein HN737_07885 [Desulfobacterales bacterium]|nr:hypothetical protein [Desulfobacterales bacterium]MBT7697316.1 hypothetical protein [Desulfobacterales bacterium]